jgi:ABC-2 type transport system permease protein
MTLARVLGAELMKLRRSRVTWLSLLAYSMGPLIGGLFMWIAIEPGRAAELGLLGTKANLVGVSADWTSYLTFMVQTTGLGGMLLLSVVAAWVFGREYAERTSKNMLALPIGRHWFVIAKLMVVLGWMIVATMLLLAEAFAIGLLLDLPDLSAAVATRGVRDILLAAGVAFLLVPPIAWLATLGRGYLPPLAFAILMLVLGNVLGATGWGQWFPWSIVPLFAGVAGPRVETLAAGSLVVLGLTALAGVAATIAQVTWSDNSQ